MSVTNDRRWKETKHLVQASHTEAYFLWCQHSKETVFPNPDAYTLVDWEEDCGGLWETIGYCDGRPVNVCFWWATINGVLVCFYEAISQVVDWKMIEEWIGRNAAGVPNVNADNFHNCLQFISEQQPKPDVVITTGDQQ